MLARRGRDGTQWSIWKKLLGKQPLVGKFRTRKMGGKVDERVEGNDPYSIGIARGNRLEHSRGRCSIAELALRTRMGSDHCGRRKDVVGIGRKDKSNGRTL